MQGSQTVLTGWTGQGRAAAEAAFSQNQAYAAAAQSSAAELATTLSRVVDNRSQLKAEISNIIEDGAQLRFTIADDGTLNDFYGQTGLWTELPEAQRALHAKLKSELPTRIAQAVATGDALDAAASAALALAADLRALAPLGSGQTRSGQDPGDGVVITSDQSQGMIHVDTGDGDSTIGVAQDERGWVTITVNGESHRLAGRQAKNIEIDSGKGNDKITVSPNVTVRLRLVDAGGNNTIHEEAAAGAYVQTGDGDNTVVLGGGHNYVYLGAGKNQVTGTKGADYINGGTGTSTINAGSGPNILYGGTGTSVINAGSGTNTVYTGSGDVTVNTHGGHDMIYAQAGSHVNATGAGASPVVVTVATTNIPDSITVSGTPEFRERVLADLQLVASSPAGQHMLEGIGNSGHTLDISNGESWNSADHGTPVRNNSFTWMADENGDPLARDPKTEFADPKTGAHGQGHNAIIAFDPTLTTLGDPAQGATRDYHETLPTVVLFHELAHAYDFTSGAMAPGYYGPNGTDRVDGQLLSPTSYLRNAEREAVGLPFNWDGESSTPETQVPESMHPYELTENGLREEMGLPDREHYLG